MSRIIMFSCVGVILFSLAAGTSWYLQFRQHEGSEGAAHSEDKAGKTLVAKPKDAISEKPFVRAPLSPDTDRMANMAATLQAQQESLKNRENQLAVREKQLDLIHDEIKKEQKKLESVRKQIETELQLVQEKIDLLEKKSAEGEKTRQKATSELEEIKSATVELNHVESKNLKQVAGMYNNMDPEAASQTIQQMIEKGKIDTAVSILCYMKERQAANLLNTIATQDATIAEQLLNRIRFMKTPPNSPK